MSGAGEEGKQFSPPLEIPEGTEVVILGGSRSCYGEKFLEKDGKRRTGELLKIIKPENSPDFEPRWAMVKLENGPIINFHLENIAIAPSEQEESF